MTNSPTYTFNSPGSGNHYFPQDSGYWFIPNSGSTIDDYVYSYAGANGGGGLLVVYQLNAIAWDNSTSSITANYTAGIGVTSAHATSSQGTNGSSSFRSGGRWVAGGSYPAPGSIQSYCIYAGTPTLPTGLSLSTGAATEGSTITITGTYLDGVTSVVFGGGVGAGFTFSGTYTSGTLSITVPSNARNGAIQLNSPNGSAYTSNFNVAPSFTGWSSASATVNSTVALYGSGLASVTQVSFPASGVGASFTAVSDTQINATVPADSGYGNITIYTAGGSAAYGTFSTTPTISSYSASSGTVNSSVTINGTGFTQVTGVSFYNSVGATYTVVSNTQINTSVPSGATTGGITVFTQSGSVTGGSFAVLPSITSLSATSGHVGDSITITGSGFTGTTAVTFTSGVSASYTVTNDTSINTTVPAGAVKGGITVTNAGGSTTSTAFSVLPYISGVSPATAPPGSSVTISGSGFTGTTAVTFYNNVAAASYTVVNDGDISAVVPNGSTSGPITVTNASGSAQSGSITVSSIHVYRAGAWTQAQNVYVYRNGAWVAANGVFVYRNGSWVSAG